MRVSIRRVVPFLCAVGLFAGFVVWPASRAESDRLPRLTPDEPIDGELAGGEEAVFIFEGQAGQVYSLSAERYPIDPESELDPLLELYDPAGTLIASDDNNGPGADALLIGVPLPADGTYTIKVYNLTTWAGGRYRLTVAETAYPEGCSSLFGTMIQAEMPSEVVGRAVRYRVYLPPCHETTASRYPYVVLLHGSNSGDELWDVLGMDEAIARGVALDRFPPVALVLPFGGDLANINTFNPGASWESVLVDELLPHVEANYCLWGEREGRAIGGISRGGFWAFVVSFRHPELFSALGGHSPFFDLYHAPATHNPLDLALAPAPDPTFRLWMDRGQNDYAALNIDLMHTRLTDNRIDHTYTIFPVGRHDNRYWSAHVDDYLAFYSAEWPSDAAALPPCSAE